MAKPQRPTYAEKRRHPRVSAQGLVQVKLYRVTGVEELSNRRVFCRTGDISLGGIRLCVGRPLPEKSTVRLSIFIMDPPSTFLHQAEVCWSRPAEDTPDTYEVGLEFLPASEERMQDWEDTLNYLVASRGG